MRILFIISSLGIGGEQRAASIITDYLIKRENKIDLICFSIFPKTIEFNESIDVNIVSKKNRFFKNLHRIYSIRKFIKSDKYDIVIGFGIIPSVLSSLAGVFLKTPIVVCERNDPGVYSLTWKFFRWVAFHFSYAAIFQTQDASNYFKSFFSKRVVIPNPLDLSKLLEVDKCKRNKMIINTSRLVPAKNHKILIEAFSSIADEFPDYNLEIYGDGYLKNDLCQLIESRNMIDRVKIQSSVPNILEIVNNAEIFVLSSNHEGFPNSLSEAMALGVACISTDCRIGGPKDMITNYKNGILVNVNDSKGIERALRELLSNYELRERISIEAVSIRNRLGSSDIGFQWHKFLSGIVSDFKGK